MFEMFSRALRPAGRGAKKSIRRSYHNSSFALKSPHQSYPLLTLKKLRKVFDGQLVFEDLSLEIKTRDRLMLFGANGAGKTTLAKIIAGEIPLDEGQLDYQNVSTIGYLPQDIEVFAEQHQIDTLEDYLLKPFPVLKKIRMEMKWLANELERNSSQPLGLQMEMKKKEYNAQGGYRLMRVMHGLKINYLDLSGRFSSLSGGEKCRVALAGLLLLDPDLLILDEPTNHLDVEARRWIQHYLQGYQKALLVITHDRDFINQVGNVMLILDHHAKTLKRFNGTYQNFLHQYKIHYEREQADREKAFQGIEDLKKELSRLQKKRTASDHVALGDKKRIRVLISELKELKKNPIPEETFIYRQPIFRFLANLPQIQTPALTFDDLSKSFEARQLIHDWHGSLMFGDRILIMGKNGSGKSTLLKGLAKKITMEGSIDYADEVKLGYLPQDTSELDFSMTVFELFNEGLNFSEGKVIRCLKESCGFDYETAYKKVGELSVGQQRKLQIAKMLASEPNVILMDEPTNHLDVLSLEALEEGILKFKGAFLAVSHDPYFVKKIATQVWKIEGGALLAEPKDKIVTSSFLNTSRNHT